MPKRNNCVEVRRAVRVQMAVQVDVNEAVVIVKSKFYYVLKIDLD
jgi:hypothetical protein